MTLVELLFRTVWLPYLAVMVVYGIWLRRGDAQLGRVATAGMVASIALHVGVLLALGFSRRIVPPVSIGESVSMLALLTAAVYVLLERRAGERGMGVFAAGLISVFAGMSAWFGPAGDVDDVLLDLWFAPHAMAVISAFAAFTMSAFLSLGYLLQYRQLRQKNFGVWVQRLPPLQEVEGMTRVVTRLGLVFLSLGLFLGMLLARSVWGEFWSWDPKQCMTLLTWLLYGLALVLRRARAWQGGRVAAANLVAFASVLLGMVLIYSIFDTAHVFG